MIDYSKIPSPCYVLEEAKLIRNLELIDSVQQRAGITILLALKGFAMFSAFPIVKKYLHGATASSLYEANLIREELGTSLHLYLPVYQDAEFDDLMVGASHITFNSLSQWERYKDRAIAHRLSPGLRINPEYSPVAHDIYNPASPYSRLGIRTEVLGDKLPEGIEGLHCHNLCESDSYALENTLEQIEKLFGHHLPWIKWLNLGGGHLMTRQGYDTEHLIQVLTQFKARHPHLQIYLEPSSAIAWETGFLRSTVLDMIETPGPAIAMLDVSFTAHMPDCLEMPYKPRIQGARDPQDGEPAYRMGGMTCLAGDVMGMGDYHFNQPLQVGDSIIFEDMIHYTMVKTTMFNGIPHPSIGILHPDGTFTLVKKFTYQDYKNRMS
ncbi:MULTISPECIES: carboxynorspermidine decarboxylase [unclassified Leptolyngbya]|uniref:carboxynorspermidine decarboxylase n=1 Tax=unclassified Leptolyngbya TaxID=2650499 RepID=UPI0016882153|nr:MULTISPECIES: carboxynorspermidine decarboxylase [unclassified Leptolyngbya]MBD1909945.1 carboxynorspermidine decarboxylase [Leptolyngbya sp. FACHB-8]MBD2154948.1 carboxynorspermidine decarboxylase [Leptolyngbya sp. FACHB-16]